MCPKLGFSISGQGLVSLFAVIFQSYKKWGSTWRERRVKKWERRRSIWILHQTKKKLKDSLGGTSISSGLIFLCFSLVGVFFQSGQMFPPAMSNSTSLSEEAASVSSGTRVQDFGGLNPVVSTISSQQQPQKIKKKRSLPGNPGTYIGDKFLIINFHDFDFTNYDLAFPLLDPDAEVIALSPKTLLATNRFVCEICNKGFQRDQNLQLHRRGHNLPWKLKQRNSKEIKKRAYVCPEPSCVHHHPSRALGDLTGIKKHYCRKHGEKKWKCEKCSKIYAVQSDWKAHSKTCGTREYRCDCGTLFSRYIYTIYHIFLMN